MTTDDLRQLCAELADLHRQLGDAIAPPRPRADDPADEPSLAAPLLAATLIATAPRYSARRRVPGSGMPFDAELIDAARAIEDTAVDLATWAREALGDLTREYTAAAALDVLPMLLARLDPGHVLVREACGVPGRAGELTRLRQRARYALGLDGRPLQLDEYCPSVQEDYVKTYAGGTEPAEWWTDGVCRTWDRAAWVDQGVDVWHRSVLYVADRDAPIGSEGGAVRCPGCGRVWRTKEEMRRLSLLLGVDPKVAQMVAQTRQVLYARLAGAMRQVVDRRIDMRHTA